MPLTGKKNKSRAESKQPGTSRSASRQPVQTKEKIKDYADEKKIEDLKLVASLVDWSNYDKTMGKIFYDKFGKVLEQKVDAFQKTKTDLKACIRENYANQRAMQTPRKAKPATALLEQISKFKALNFDSDDEVTTLLDQPEQIVQVKGTEEQSIGHEIEEYLTERRQSFEPGHPVEEELSMEYEQPIEPERHIVSEESPIAQQLPMEKGSPIESEHLIVPERLFEQERRIVPEEPLEEERPKRSEEPLEEERPKRSEEPLEEERPKRSLEQEHPVEQHTPNEKELPAEKEISFVPETPIAYRVCTPIINPSTGVSSTPITPYSPMIGTSRGIIGSSNNKKVIRSMRKLAITNEIIKSTQQPIQMPPILRLTPMKNTPQKNTFATPKKTPAKIPIRIPAKTPVALNTTFQKIRKLKQIDEKADQAKKAREDQLRERADRAKREREERAKRVEQNNKKKEETRLERENNMRRHLEAVKEYQNKEKQATIQNKFASPIVQTRVFQPLSVQSKKTHKTLNMKDIPASEAK
ncbi:hypothetical protein ACQ4LE_007177 [Meloidogyne hapla]